MPFNIVDILIEGIKEQVAEDLKADKEEAESQETNPADTIEKEMKAITDQFTDLTSSISKLVAGDGKASDIFSDTDEEGKE